MQSREPPRQLEISISGKYGTLRGPLSARVYDTARTMPGRAKWRDGILWFELSGGNFEHLHVRHPEASWSPEAKAELEKIQQLRQVEEDSRQSKKIASILPDEYEYKTKPYEHQARIFQIQRDRKVFGLFLEMRLGKSKIILDTAAYLYSKDLVDALIIFAPNGVHRQWINEQVPEHLPDWVPRATFIYQAGCLQSAKVREYFKYVCNFDGLRIFSINIETMSHDSGLQFVRDLLDTGIRVLVALDESSRIKNHKSKRTKNIMSIRDRMDYRRILSGTPITKGCEDLYAQFEFMDPNILGFKSFFTFRNRYCVMGGYEQKQIVGYKNLEELQHRVDGHTFRMTRAECSEVLKNPPMIIEVDMTGEQERIYHELKNQFITDLGNGEIVTAALAVTRLMRLQQVLCGHLPIGEDKIQEIPSNRPGAAADFVEEANAKVVMWARFRYDGQSIREELKKRGIGYVVYGGATSPEDREKAIHRFRNDDSCLVFLGNPQVAGLGLDLSVSDFVLWYSCSFDLEQYLQANQRIDKIGKKTFYTYGHLQCPGTVDRKIWRSLINKKKISDMMLDIRDIVQGANDE